ncbi:MAG: hypothetical protein HY744_29430 [Deltaproteobacteria bacterium]|nr:hypothetical protein [Deltaproteobacteria bacterium]
MRITIRAARECDGRWCATLLGVRGFAVSPVLADTRAEAVEKARSAVLFGLSCAIADGLVRGPNQVTFVVSDDGESDRNVRGPRARRGRVARSSLQILSP